MREKHDGASRTKRSREIRIQLTRRFFLLGRGKSGFSAVAQTLVGRVAILVVNLLCGILTARFLGPHGRGVQTTLILWPMLFSYVLTFGIPSAVRYHVRKHPQDRDTLVSMAFVIALALGIVVSLIGIAVIPLFLKQYDAETVRWARIFLLFAPELLVSVTMSAVFEASLDFSAANWLRFSAPFLTLLGLVGLALTHRFEPVASGFAYTLPPVLLLFVRLPRAMKHFRWSFVDRKRATNRLLGYGLRVYGADVLGTLSLYLDQVLVVGLLSPKNLGIYTVALSFSKVLSVVENSVVAVLLPKATGRTDREAVDLVVRATRVTLAADVACGAALAALMPFVIPFFFGAKFQPAVAVAQVLTLQVVVAATMGTLLQAFMATNRAGMATVLQAVGLCIVFPLMQVLIPRYGLMGAAISLLGATLARLLFGLASFPRLLHRGIPNLILQPADLRYVRAQIAARRTSATEGA